MDNRNKVGKLLKLIYFALGFIFGYQIGVIVYAADWYKNVIPESVSPGLAMAVTYIVFALAGAVFFSFLVPVFGRIFEKFSLDWIKQIKTMSPLVIVERVVIIILALIIASLISSPVYKLDLLLSFKIALVVMIYVASLYFANLLCSSFEEDAENFFSGIISRFRISSDARKDDDGSKALAKITRKKTQPVPKILDTSVIIDGRIGEILSTGFIDGPIVIPSFVVEELQFVSDSSDPMKRNRGRAGLDLVNRMKDAQDYDVVISEKDYTDITEVDAKLIKLAKDLKGKIITNDYNLNKVAEIQGVSVLNINDLSNTVKTVVLPGERIRVHILREGKENNQGIAYHSDGTMIVVDNGRSLIGKDINAEVTSVLQTSAGRMIFAKPVQ